MKRDKEWQKLYENITESKAGATIIESDKPLFERLVHNEMKYLKEETFSGDIARVGEILVPVFRRAFPQLIAKELVGVQPLSQPSGHVFALRYHYKGNYGVGVAGHSANSYVVGGGQNGGPVGPTGQGQSMTATTSVVVVYADAAAKIADIDFATGVTDVGAGEAHSNTSTAIGAVGTSSGTVIYSESNRALIEITAADLSSALAVVSAGGSACVVVYNDAGYDFIFSAYSGPWFTDIGEAKGDDIEELGLTIEKILVEAKTRKLRASYTIEAAQDMKAIHGKDLAAELIDILTYEITQSIDRDLISAIRSAATTVAAYDVLGTGSGAGDADGRWSVEKYRNAYTELIRLSNDIAKTTLRGPGNFIIASPDVATMLETIPAYTTWPVPGAIDTSAPVNSMGHALVGTIGGRFRVYRDIFAANDATIVGYKGPSQYDTGVIWSPYVPLTMTKVVQQESGQPRIIFSERSAISQTPFSSDQYYRSITFNNIFTKGA